MTKKSSLPIQNQQAPRLEVWWTGRLYSIKTNQLWSSSVFNSMEMEQHSLAQVVWGSPHQEAAVTQLPRHSSTQTTQLHCAQPDSSSPVLQLLLGKHSFQWKLKLSSKRQRGDFRTLSQIGPFLCKWDLQI